jgi:Glycoside-hydrolase family GH114
MRRSIAWMLLPLLLLVAAAPASALEPLPVGTDVDYQLGGVRPVPAHVGIVVRDRKAPPIPGRHNVCYVNGFQTQPDERTFWNRRPALLLRKDGRRVVDGAWGEWLLDIRTPEKRQRLAGIMGSWTRGCAASGFDSVEFDNLDSFTRSRRMIRQSQAVAYARLLVRNAHAAGLTAGQKNLAELDGRSIDYDFAVAEECGRYRECAAYVANYGRRVLSIEYRREDFRWTCARFGSRLPVVLRDRALSPGGVRAWC